MEVLTFEHGEVRLDNELVPGILQNLRVSGKVRFDEQKVDGGSGKKKAPQGWEDCDITFSLILTNDEDSSCYDKLRKLSEMFNAPDDKANPKVMAVTNRHLLARGVRRVVFSRFDSTEADRTDEITVSLGFAEHNPPIVRAEQAQAKSRGFPRGNRPTRSGRKHPGGAGRGVGRAREVRAQGRGRNVAGLERDDQGDRAGQAGCRARHGAGAGLDIPVAPPAAHRVFRLYRGAGHQTACRHAGAALRA